MPDLIQIADAALADSYTRAGHWMTCHPGCHQCCIGVFPISPADATRLRAGLELADIPTAARIRTRAAAARGRLTPDFPGDPTTGELFTEPHHEDLFEDFANDEGGLAVCELCFIGAPATEVARCAVDAIFFELESDLEENQHSGPTLIAFALSTPTDPLSP